MIQNAYVGLGSNLGDRAGYLLLAVRGMLDAGLDVIRVSSIYETAPVDNIDQPAFLNMVAELSGPTLPSPAQLLAGLLRIEYSLGRTRDASSDGCSAETSERRMPTAMPSAITCGVSVTACGADAT